MEDNFDGVDTRRTIEELEGIYWPEPAEERKSNIVLKSNALRKKPLKELGIEDIRVGLVQQVGIIYIVRIAIDLLTHDPMLESLNYEGEILEALLNLPRSFWLRQPLLAAEVDKLYERFEQLISDMRDSWKEICLPDIIEAYGRFRGSKPSRKWLRSEA